MKPLASPYYPPRARWYSPLLLLPGQLRGTLVRDRIRRQPRCIPFGMALWSLLVPGFGIWLREPRLWGKVAFGLSALLALTFVAGLGSAIGNAAFGLLFSLHLTSVLFAFEPWLAGQRFRLRLLVSFGFLFSLVGFLYLPARSLVQEYWLLPLQVKGRVVIVRRVASAYSPARGAWLAYSYDGFNEHGLSVPGGFGLAPVLALPGDRVRFTRSTVEVNGVPQPRQLYMPRAGEWVVPEKHWFVWTEVAIGGNMHVSPEVLSAALFKLGTITEAQFVGRPCKRWFWRGSLEYESFR